MPRKEVRSLSRKDDEKLFAFLASFLTIIGFIIAFILRRENKYVMFYAKQGLILFIGQLVIAVVDRIPVVGFNVFSLVLLVIWIVLWVVTWLNALSGIQKSTWLIGELADKIRL